MNKQAFMMEYQKKADIDWGSMAQKYAPTVIGAGIGLGAVGIHDVLQSEEADKQETKGSKALKYLAGAGAGAAAGYGAGKLYDRYGPNRTTPRTTGALAEQYGGNEALEQSLADAAEYRKTQEIKPSQDLDIDTYMAIPKGSLDEQAQKSREAMQPYSSKVHGLSGLIRDNMYKDVLQLNDPNKLPADIELRRTFADVRNRENKLGYIKAIAAKQGTRIKDKYDARQVLFKLLESPKGRFENPAPQEYAEIVRLHKLLRSGSGFVPYDVRLKYQALREKYFNPDFSHLPDTPADELRNLFKSIPTGKDRQKFIDALSEEMPGVVGMGASSFSKTAFNKQAFISGYLNKAISKDRESLKDLSTINAGDILGDHYETPLGQDMISDSLSSPENIKQFVNELGGMQNISENVVSVGGKWVQTPRGKETIKKFLTDQLVPGVSKYVHGGSALLGAGLGAGLGVAGIGIHDILQSPEQDKQETKGSKFRKYLAGAGAGAGLGAAAGYGAGRHYVNTLRT